MKKVSKNSKSAGSKTGPKPGDPKNVRNRKLAVKISLVEEKQVKVDAAEAGQTVTAYVRDRLKLPE